MTENYDSANALSTENPDCALVPVAVRKPVVVLLTTSATKGRSIRHWIVAGVTDLESGVLFSPTAATVEEAYERLEELVHFERTKESPRFLVHIEDEPHAYVITYDMTEGDEISVPLVWRGHPIRVVTMDSPVRADAKAVLCRYRGRMSKELRVYRGDLDEEALE
jgi:hypothetical protein